MSWTPDTHVVFGSMCTGIQVLLVINMALVNAVRMPFGCNIRGSRSLLVTRRCQVSGLSLDVMVVEGMCIDCADRGRGGEAQASQVAPLWLTHIGRLICDC